MLERSKVKLFIAGRERDIGGFTVRRILPYISHAMVGPFIFFDHMGPAILPPGDGMNVRPHPHINLATVSYLFSGIIQHRDSLGFDQAIEPGAINWMTAGRGIVHSERTPEHLTATGGPVNGIQLWVALPEEREEMEPSFSHHPKESLPLFKVGDVEIKLLLGTLFDYQSPVPVHSDLFYAEVNLHRGQHLKIPANGREIAVYSVEGQARVEGQVLAPFSMAIGRAKEGLEIEASGNAKLMILGGKPLGKRYIYWNFVSSSQARIEEAKREWEYGPRVTSDRFKPIPGDDKEFIPLPTDPSSNPKGTIL